MFFHPMRTAGIMAASALLNLAGDRGSLRGVEIGQLITYPVPQTSTVITSDFAEGIAPRLGKYTLIAREEIDTQTGEVRDGAFEITAAGGATILGTYTGQASFAGASASWIADGAITGGTGRFAGASGTVHFEGSSDLSACRYVGALAVCPFSETSTIDLVLR